MVNNNTSAGLHDIWFTAVLWLVLMISAIVLRPLLPIDETRYLSVAWEMHTSGSYLVPHINGELYSHKPPLLFWLINAGWYVFGVSQYWARAVAPLFGLGALWLSVKMVDALWPDSEANILRLRRAIAPLMLLSGVYWSVFSTMTMFDMMLTFATMLSLLGVINAWRCYVGGKSNFWKNILLVGFGLGLGGLAKGPVILLHVLPVFLVAPLWGPHLSGKKPISWKKWYVSVLLAVLIGLGIALGWAIPAAVVGGPEYRDAIFIGQSAGRVVKSFAHQRPIWWFLQFLPFLLLPWFAWPRLWRAVGFRKSWRAHTGLRSAINDGGIRFLGLWFAITFIVFSLISGKQLHYLLPEFPALALFAAYLLTANQQNDEQPKRGHMVPVLIMAGIGALLILAWVALPKIETIVPRMPSWAYEVTPVWMVPVFLLGMGLAMVRLNNLMSEVRTIAMAAVTLIVLTHMTAAPALRHAYDLELPAKLVFDWQKQGKDVAWVGKYNGEFHFLGKLERPLITFDALSDAIGWAKTNQDAIVIDVVRIDEIAADPIAFFPYRGKYLVAWNSRDLAKVK